MLLALLLAIAAPANVVERFCATYVRQAAYGTLEGKHRRAIAPLLSKALLQHVDDVTACQRDWVRQQPKNTTDKPPFVDCCLFAGIPEGPPTSYKVGEPRLRDDGRYEVPIDWTIDMTDLHDRWRDLAIVKQERGRWVIDDFVFHADDGPFRLSEPFEGCQGGRWIGG